MNLVASLVVRNELARYLAPCIDHLRVFCDRIVVLDDASDDGTADWLALQADAQLVLVTQTKTTFYVHEGATRTSLLHATLREDPTHVLPLDADEFVSDGPALRAALEEQPDVAVWGLPIQEVWNADMQNLHTRVDGGWSAGRTQVWRPPGLARLTFANRRLACGRTPSQIRMRTPEPLDVSLLHVGWLNESERKGRAARYAQHDQGRFHARAHLESILWPPERIKLAEHPWPSGLVPWRDTILEHANVTA